MWFAAFPLAFHCRKALGRSGRRLSLKGPLRQLAFYGLPRVPANFALAGLFAVGPFLAPYFGSLKEAGYLAAGQSVLTAIGGGVAAFGLVALPRLAEMAMQGRQETIEEAVEGIITLVLHLGLFAMLQGLLWANEIVLAVLGSQYREVTPLMRVVLLALVPYLAYVMLRSVVDAVEDRAINTANLFLALVVTLVASVIMVTIGWGTLGLAMSTTVGFMTLGASTVFYLMRRYQFKWQGLRLRQVLPLNVGFLVLGVLAKLGLEATLKGALLLPCTAITVIGTAAFYVFILWRLNIGWLVELERRILVHWER
jgi:O-antigen/teichoic acid export membrane protein